MKLRKKMFISYAILDIYNEYVAPRAGAWIETSLAGAQKM